MSGKKFEIIRSLPDRPFNIKTPPSVSSRARRQDGRCRLPGKLIGQVQVYIIQIWKPISHKSWTKGKIQNLIVNPLLTEQLASDNEPTRIQSTIADAKQQESSVCAL
jgi:hypothetical protein